VEILMLAYTIYLSFAGTLVLAAWPRAWNAAARIFALLVALAGLGIALVAFAAQNGQGTVSVADLAWIPALGIHYMLAADGISRVLVLLTGLAAVAGILFSWNIGQKGGDRANEFFAFFLALIGGVYGVFLSVDLFLLFVFYEIAIVPKYFLIAIWGSARREYGAMKLALYSFAGSAMVLIGLLAAYAAAGSHTMDLHALAQYPYPVSFQMWAFPLVFTGFAVLAGMWPFHTWAPTGHVAASTAASMLLAGVVMKLGAYGCLRIAMTLFPRGLDPWGFSFLGIDSWRTVFALLAVIGIVYGAAVALVQNDFKFVIGYSSVSHMGLVLLGLLTLTQIGIDGAVLQMFSHGILAGLLFATVGRIVYERAHTRDLGALSKLQLAKAMPFAAWLFVLAGMASMGLPGFSGFVAEVQVLAGAWRAFPWFAVVAGVGIVIGVAYTWRAMQRAFFSDAPALEASGIPLPVPEYEPVTWAEKTGVFLLAGASLLIGLYPRLLLDAIAPAVQALPHALLTGGRP
jgi:NADH-quinone oxidoreductase subunit M